MSHRAPIALVLFAAAFCAGWVARGNRHDRGPVDPTPETIEVYRHPAPDRPAVAETLRTTDPACADDAGSDGPAVWTIRLNRGGRVTTYTAEGVSRRP